MSARTLTRLVVAAGGLLAIWFLLVRVPWPTGGSGSETSEQWTGFFSRLNRVTGTAVRMDGPDGSKHLARAGDRWTIEGFPADSGTVARFWGVIEDASTPELVARNPENHPRLGLSSDSAHTLTFELEDETRSLLVGHEGPSPGSNFVRLPDGDDSYLLNANLRAYSTRSVSDWRERRVVIMDTSAVSRVEVDAEESFTLTRGDSVWTLADGSEAAPTAVRGLLEELATLRSNGALEEDDALLDHPAASWVTALTETGDTLAFLTLGGAEGDQWVTAQGQAVVAGNDGVFVLPRFRVDRLMPPRERVEGN